jgi:hypothetical protein
MDLEQVPSKPSSVAHKKPTRKRVFFHLTQNLQAINPCKPPFNEISAHWRNRSSGTIQAMMDAISSGCPSRLAGAAFSQALQGGSL